VQNLYLQHWRLRTKNRELKGKLHQREKQVEVSGLEILTLAALG